MKDDHDNPNPPVHDSGKQVEFIPECPFEKSDGPRREDSDFIDISKCRALGSDEVISLNLEIGLWLKRARRNAGRTRTAVARATGISAHRISRFEKGGPVPFCDIAELVTYYKLDPNTVVMALLDFQLRPFGTPGHQ